ncbi:MAG: hypothetical protein AUJ70_01565 [Candidatus Omnitrophica bacterium CG1_02_40_15]|nr:MAG: hypothetical protein AUJ70_01565 [Candidatus Omnitrophica bacterium CG1_02_40_15]
MPKIARLFIPLIILAGIFSYLNSIHNEFIWDDEDFVLKNSTVKDWHKWPTVFTENMIHGARKGSNFYRPLQSLTHGFDYMVWKDKPLGHHVSNIIFHILAGVAAYLMLRKIFSINIAFLAALFFIIHPVQTEVVTYISGRSDAMAAFFVMLTIIFFEKNLLAAIVAFILSLMSKESALIGPCLLMVYLLFKNGSVKPYSKKLFLLFLIMFGYCTLRLTVLDFSKTVSGNLPQPFFYVPLWIRFCTFLKALPVYFSILLWPFGLHMERQMDLAQSIFEPQVFSGFLMLAGIFFIAYRIRKFNMAMLFSACWFFIALFPNSNIIPINALIYEHWLYLPSLGFFITAAWIIEELLKQGKILKYAVIFITISIGLFYMWRTIERNKEWRDHISFYESTIKYVPNSARLHNNLAMAYSDKGRAEDAIDEYKMAVRLGDYYPQTHFNLSNIYIAKGDYKSAMEELQRSVEIDNNFLYSHENLAILYFNQKKNSEAKAEAEFILRKEPDNKIAHEILRKILE